jgi:hypothetical protein
MELSLAFQIDWMMIPLYSPDEEKRESLANSPVVALRKPISTS